MGYETDVAFHKRLVGEIVDRVGVMYDAWPDTWSCLYSAGADKPFLQQYFPDAFRLAVPDKSHMSVTLVHRFEYGDQLLAGQLFQLFDGKLFKIEGVLAVLQVIVEGGVPGGGFVFGFLFVGFRLIDKVLQLLRIMLWLLQFERH